MSNYIVGGVSVPKEFKNKEFLIARIPIIHSSVSALLSAPNIGDIYSWYMDSQHEAKVISVDELDERMFYPCLFETVSADRLGIHPVGTISEEFLTSCNCDAFWIFKTSSSSVEDKIIEDPHEGMVYNEYNDTWHW